LWVASRRTPPGLTFSNDTILLTRKRMRSIRPLEQPDPPKGGGTISAIQVQKKDQDRCSLFLNGTFAFGIHMNLVADHGLKKGVVLDEEACRSLMSEDLYYKAMKRCVDYLAYRPRSTSEIEQRLRELNVPETVGEKVKDRLGELGYLNDERFAQQWAASRHRSKGFGPRRLEMELIQKGIPAEMARKVVAETCSADDVEEQLAVQIGKARHRYRHEGDERKREQKIIGFLSRRGFDVGAIRDALRQPGS